MNINRRKALGVLASATLFGVFFKEQQIHPEILKEMNLTFGSKDNFVKYITSIPVRKVDKCCNANFGLNANRVMVQTFASFCRQYKRYVNTKYPLKVISVYDENGNKTFRWNESIPLGFHCEVTTT